MFLAIPHGLGREIGNAGRDVDNFCWLILPCACAATAITVIRVAVVALLDTGDHGITTSSVTPLLLDPVN
jgi:hypothetical protein